MPIIAVPRKDLSNFERLYFFEADTPNARTNVRKITLGDNGKASVNGTETDNDDVDLDSSDMPDDDDDTDGTDMDDDNDDEVSTEPDEEDMSDDDEDTDDEDTDSEGENDDVALEPDDNDMDGDSEDGSENDTDDTGDDESSEDIDETTRKRALFSRIDSLYEAIDKYTEKLNMLMTNASDNVAIYRKACDALDDLRVYTYDYMIVRFTKAKYTESMLFYQRVLTALSLILDDLYKSLPKKAKDADNDDEQRTPKPSHNVLG